MVSRRTIIVQGRLAFQMVRAQAARADQSGVQILRVSQVAARLAGGFLHVATEEAIEPAIRSHLHDGALQDLTDVRELPGMTRAIARTLRKVWQADVALLDKRRRKPHARIADIVAIEAEIRRQLPPAALLPADLRDAALARIALAPTLLGEISLEGVHFVEPVWRPLMNALATVMPIVWHAPPHADTGWFAGTVKAAAPASVEPELLSCASPKHEALEALRWARSLLAGGGVTAAQIAICAASTDEWDEHFLSLAEEAGLRLHFPHGVSCLTTRDGQRCAALADIMLHGLSQTRVRRLFGLAAGQGTAIDALPPIWLRVPRGVSLGSSAEWRRALDAIVVEGEDWRQTALALIALLENGTAAANEAASSFLRGRSRRFWDEAIRAAPIGAVEFSLRTIRINDENDAADSVVWCHAAHLAAAPRPHVRLIGLTSRSWPRRFGEDPILPDHIVQAAELDPDPPAEADLRAFRAIIASATRSIVLSRHRRSAQGSRVTASPLFVSAGQTEQALAAGRIPDHALTEADRLAARLPEAIIAPSVAPAVSCWRNWHLATATAHDGVVSASHPALRRAIDQLQSATSLNRLLRDPIGFLWRYALHWQPLSEIEQPLVLPPQEFGRLVHELLRRTVDTLEPRPGFIVARPDEIEAALSAAVVDVTARWPLERPVPPHVLWINTVRQAAEMSLAGLTLESFTEAGTQSWTEVPFGQAEPPEPETRSLPWDPCTPVVIPGVELHIRGSIDRVDLRAGAVAVRVTDYKTGDRVSSPDTLIIGGGTELQRVLYAIASQQLLPGCSAIRSRLIYLKGSPAIVPLVRLEPAIELVVKFVQAACAAIAAGKAVPGIGAESEDNDLRFALPASPGYFRRKGLNFRAANRELTRFWSVK